MTRYGYLAVALVVLAEGVGIPTPAVTTLVVAAAYAGTGRLNVVALAVVAMLAASAGDNLGYLVGRTAGKPAALRWGRYVGLTPRRLDRAESFVARRGAIAVPVARFVDGLRQTNGLIAGVTGMPWRRYLVLDGIGAVVWAGVWVGVGYGAGTQVDQIRRTAGRLEGYLLLAVAVLAAATVAGYLYRRRRRRRSGSAP